MSHFLRTRGKSQIEELLKRGGDGFAHNLRGCLTVGWLNTYPIIYVKDLTLELTKSSHYVTQCISSSRREKAVYRDTEKSPFAGPWLGAV